MLSKFNEEPTKAQHSKRRKSKDNDDEEKECGPLPAKRGRRAKNKIPND